MFADDLRLCGEMVAKWGPILRPVIECGGIPDPTIAEYQKTIDAMEALRTNPARSSGTHEDRVRAAQMCRYLQIHRPLSFIDENYVCEDPATGGVALEDLLAKYDPALGSGIGTAILLSVLEHVADPFVAIDGLRDAMQVGGLAIVSVPWAFPTHYGPEDNWRISESGLRHIFGAPKGEPSRWTILESGARLNVPAEAGVLDQHGRAQIIQSAFICARAS